MSSQATRTRKRREFLDKMFGFDGQVVVVIGATGVLGSEFAKGIAQAGAHVVVAGRSKPRGSKVVADIEALGGTAEYRRVDVTNRRSIKLLKSHVVGTHGKVDGLVNCFGVNSGTPFLEIEPDEWDRIIQANLTAVKDSCQVFIGQMKDQGYGSVINIESITSWLPLSRVFTYSASKGGLANLTENLGAEFAPFGVRTNGIWPGFFPAEQNRKILDAERVRQIMERTPMGRFGDGHELVGSALLLLHPFAGSFMTGTHIVVSGGFGARWM